MACQATGPRAPTGGFGSQLSALAGFSGLTGEADGSPMLLYGPYIDFVAALVSAPAVLAALDRRKRTGEGAYFDVAQYECGLSFIAGALFGAEIYVPYLLIDEYGFSATAAGFGLTAAALLWAAGAEVQGRFGDRLGNARITLIGASLLAAAALVAVQIAIGMSCGVSFVA